MGGGREALTLILGKQCGCSSAGCRRRAHGSHILGKVGTELLLRMMGKAGLGVKEHEDSFE